MEDVKEKILIGAEELFMHNGIKSTTMDDLASHLGVSKKTIYQFFEDKDEIVFVVATRHFERHRKQMEAIANNSVNVLEELMLLTKQIRKTLSSVHSSVLFDLQKYYPKAWEHFLKFKESCMAESIARNLYAGIEQGFFRPDISVSVLTKLRMEEVQMAFNPQLFPAESYNLIEVQIQLFDHFVYGLLTEQGRMVWEKYKNNNN